MNNPYENGTFVFGYKKMSMSKCEDCTYDERGRLTHTCGPCEEEAIKARIQWWQDGKRKLKEKEHDG